MNQKTYPFVSVIMPIYNHEDFVEQALNSILMQTYPNIEIILIDDGSKDHSCTRVDETLAKWNQTKHFDRKITFIKQTNKGAHHTINLGLSLAKGDWLTILNSDDYYHLSRIEKLVASVMEGKAEFAFSYVAGIDKNNQPLPPNNWWWRWYEGAKHQLFNAPTVGFQLIQDNIAVSTGNLFFSKELYNAVGPFKDLKLAHDLDFILRALLLAEPLLIRETLYFYRLHGHNTQYQVQHLMESEINEIYRTYLVGATKSPPKNPTAPCYWYWPLEFGNLRTKLNMNRSLDTFIIRPKTQLLLSEKKNLQSSFPAQSPNQTKTLSKKTKVTLISHELTLSGAPKLVVDLAVYLKSQGYEPNVISIFDGPMKNELKKHGIPVFTAAKQRSFKKFKIFNNSLTPFLYLFFAFIFKTEKITIANSIISWPLILLMTLLRPWRSPIWYIHESYTPTAVIRGVVGKIASALFHWSCKKSPPKLWFGSEATRTAWEYSGLPKGEVVYWSGMSTPSLSRTSRTRLTNLLVVGTACSRKGTHHLIEAFISCIKKGLIAEDVTLTIIGFSNANSPDFLALGDTILKVIHSGYQDRIKMIGSLEPSALEAYYQSADLFIQPSIQECLPLSLLMAMSHALPIITTNVDGCGEAIQNDETGYVCLPYNILSLENSIIEALNNPVKSQEMGIKAQKVFADRFSLDMTKNTILRHLNTE